MTPLQVLERQHGFLLKYENEPTFQQYVHGCFDPRMAWSSEDKVHGDRYIEATLVSFRNAEAYRVTEHMCDLVTYAAGRLDSSDRVDRTLAPSPFGFVAFEKPLPMWDARGELMLMHYLTWAQVVVPVTSPITGRVERKAGFWISMWNDQIEQPDATFQRLRESPQFAGDVKWLLKNSGRYGFIGSESFVDGNRIGDVDTVIAERVLEEMRKEDAAFSGQGLVIPPPIGKHTNAARYVHALWLLLGQTLTDVREDPLSRAAAKMVGRMKIPGRVTVVQLRRRETRQSEGETHVEWMHRWMVKGHWRWQPYGNGRVERIWIHPYVKGPEGKPFKQSEKVYDLSR